MPSHLLPVTSTALAPRDIKKPNVVTLPLAQEMMEAKRKEGRCLATVTSRSSITKRVRGRPVPATTALLTCRQTLLRQPLRCWRPAVIGIRSNHGESHLYEKRSLTSCETEKSDISHVTRGRVSRDTKRLEGTGADSRRLMQEGLTATASSSLEVKRSSRSSGTSRHRSFHPSLA